MSFLTAEQITKKYANHVALDKVSIDVPEQTIFGLLGPNGAGKTSLIRIINMITAPDEGTILYKGEKLNQSHNINIGYLPEERGLYKKMKVGEQALYLSQLKGVSKQDALKKLKFWFEKFNLSPWWNRKAEELSKGMQQKLQFIITILHNPQLLIFDEPFTGFDPINTQLLREEILNLRKNGSTIILSTHNMASVEELCDNIVLINKSKTILQGNIKEIKSKFKSNTYNVHITGFRPDMMASLQGKYEIIEMIQEGETVKLRMRIPSNLTSNDLVQEIINFGNILMFNEILPTMNDIFIETVNNN